MTNSRDRFSIFLSSLTITLMDNKTTEMMEPRASTQTKEKTTSMMRTRMKKKKMKTMTMTKMRTTTKIFT